MIDEPYKKVDIDQLELALDFGVPGVKEFEEALATDGGIFDRVWDERYRQVDKWGEQNHPFFSGSASDKDMQESYALTAESSKVWNEMYVQQGQIGWDTILLEEVWEALEQAGVDDEAYEKELIEVMAVAAAMIEANRRRRGVPHGEVRGHR